MRWKILGGALLVAAPLLFFAGGDSVPWRIAWRVVSLFVGSGGVRLYNEGRRRDLARRSPVEGDSAKRAPAPKAAAARPMAWEIEATDPRPPILYLRRFRDDRKAAAPGADGGLVYLAAFKTEEEQLVELLEDLGTVKALGEPDEALPRLGADRVYATHGEWKERVESLLRRARLVVLRVGEGESVAWELEKARSLVEPERLVLLVPDTQEAKAVARRFCEESLGQRLGRLPRSSPLLVSITALIYFKAAWEPVVVPLKMPFLRSSLTEPAVPIFQVAFEPVLRQLEIPWYPPRYSRVLGLLIAVAVVVVIVALVRIFG